MTAEGLKADGTGDAHLLARLRASLAQTQPALKRHDDYDFLTARPGFAAAPAAVLLPLILRDEPVLLFTRRTDTLSRHGGQVAFPGGRTEVADLSPVETALRETFEETGIAPGFVSVAGYLDRYLTGTGFEIQPVVGVLSEGFALKPDPREVAALFEVPLAFLLDPANRRRESRVFAGQERHFFAYSWEGQEIWGATAAIIVNLAEHLNSAAA